MARVKVAVLISGRGSNLEALTRHAAAADFPAELALVIFDCDGVLIDSERIAVRVDAEILGELGWKLTEAAIIERVAEKKARSLAKLDPALRRRRRAEVARLPVEGPPPELVGLASFPPPELEPFLAGGRT